MGPSSSPGSGRIGPRPASSADVSRLQARPGGRPLVRGETSPLRRRATWMQGSWHPRRLRSSAVDQPRTGVAPEGRRVRRRAPWQGRQSTLTAVAVWFVFGLIAFGVGAVREVFLRPRVGEPTAHAIGTLSAVALVALVISRLHPASPRVVFEGRPAPDRPALAGADGCLRVRLLPLRRGQTLGCPAGGLQHPAGTALGPGAGDGPAGADPRRHDPGVRRGAGPVLGLGISLDERTASLGAAAAGSRTTCAPPGDGPPVAGRRTGPGVPTSDEAGGKMAMR